MSAKDYEIREAVFLRPVTRVDQAPRPARPAIAFAGRSNVGKSSLINALTRRKGLARTSSTPGRTQEIIYFDVNERWHFVDLPGYGYAKAPEKVRRKWGPMIERFIREADDLKLVVVILDVRRDPAEQDKQLIAWLSEMGRPYIFAVTKIDKVGRDALRKRLTAIQEALGLENAEALLPFSAKTGAGRRDLLEVIAAAAAE